MSSLVLDGSVVWLRALTAFCRLSKASVEMGLIDRVISPRKFKDGEHLYLCVIVLTHPMLLESSIIGHPWFTMFGSL